MKILLTPLYHCGKTKYDLLEYLLENNIPVSAVPGEMYGENGVIIIKGNPEIVSLFSHYPWAEYNKNTCTFFVNGEEAGKVSCEEPSLEDSTKQISVELPDSECSLKFNSSAMYIQMLQK